MLNYAEMIILNFDIFILYENDKTRHIQSFLQLLSFFLFDCIIYSLFYRNEDIERLKLAEIGLKYDPTQKLHKTDPHFI